MTPAHPGISHNATGLHAAGLNAQQSADNMVNTDVTCLKADLTCGNDSSKDDTTMNIKN